jgi:hypothetical protein
VTRIGWLVNAETLSAQALKGGRNIVFAGEIAGEYAAKTVTD